jgi:ketosteroid isomerase-like protein
MSRTNEQVAREAIDAVNRRDVKRLLELCDPEVEFHAYFSDVLGGTFNGHSGMRDYLREIADNFDEFVIEVQSIEEREGDLAVAYMTAHGRGVSGVAIEWNAVVAARFRDGLVWRMASRPTEAEALDAVMPTAAGS